MNDKTNKLSYKKTKIFIWGILTVLALVLFSLYFIQRCSKEDHPGISSGERVFPRLNKDDVHQIILNGNGRTRKFILTGTGRWVLSDAQGDFPAKNECFYIIDVLTELNTTNLLFEEIERPHLYGLTDEGGYRVELKDFNGKTLASVRVGLPMEDTEYNYLSLLDKDQIYRVDRDFASLIMGDSLLDFRIFPELSGSAQVSEFEVIAAIDNPQLNYHLQQDQNNRWHSDEGDLKDSGKVNKVINGVIDWKGESFVGIDPSDWNSAPLRIQITDSLGKASILLIGERLDDRAIAVKREGSDLVYRLTIESLAQLEPLDFYNKP